MLERVNEAQCEHDSVIKAQRWVVKGSPNTGDDEKQMQATAQLVNMCRRDRIRRGGVQLLPVGVITHASLQDRKSVV